MSTVTVMWCGEKRSAKVLKRYKNGRVRVQVARGRWVGGRPGSASNDINITVEPWQIMKED